MDMDIDRWEDVTKDRTRWRHDLYKVLEREEKRRLAATGMKSTRWKVNYRGKVSLLGFIAFEAVTPVSACTAIKNAASESWGLSLWAHIQHLLWPTGGTQKFIVNYLTIELCWKWLFWWGCIGNNFGIHKWTVSDHELLQAALVDEGYYVDNKVFLCFVYFT